jgi:8-oxo-dGTP pyrophosphatase MutT (NUDIX family)
MKPRAVALIIDHTAHAILLIHRWKEGRQYYVLPGGKIEEGETPLEACIREAREETGLAIVPGRQVASFINMGRAEHYFLATRFSGTLELGFPEKGYQTKENVYKLEWVPAEILSTITLQPEKIRPVVDWHLANPD